VQKMEREHAPGLDKLVRKTSARMRAKRQFSGGAPRVEDHTGRLPRSPRKPFGFPNTCALLTTKTFT